MTGTVDGLILAGGQGARFGNANKALIVWREQTLLQHVAGRLEPQVSTLLVSANKDLPTISAMGWPAFSDNPDEGAGPLAGMATAWQHSRADWLMTVPTDMPLIPSYLVEEMVRKVGGDRQLAVAHDGNRRQNCVLLIHRGMRDSMLTYLEGGRRSVAGWLDQTPHREVNFAHSTLEFSNLNSKEDLLRLEAAHQVR